MKPWLLVLAGGSGTRFWPRSRGQRPKQLLAIAGEEPLLCTTLRRFQGWIAPAQMLVVTTEALGQPTQKVLADFPDVQVLCEPESRNTAPSLVMAMEWIRAKDPQATVVVVPADHWITDIAEYINTMKNAVRIAREKQLLVTVGIQPTRAETGYGYIRSGEEIGDGAFTVERFVEKPKKEVAETMVQSPEYLWNAGMFVWTAESFFQQMEKHSPELVKVFAEYRVALAKGKEAVSTLKRDYGKATPISIDYALLEKSKSVAVVPGSTFGWNDLGSFVSLGEIFPQAEGGVARAKRVMAVDSIANIVDCPGKTVALLGVSDMILVDVGDVLLLASKERAQDVKKFVERLKSEGRQDLL